MYLFSLTRSPYPSFLEERTDPCRECLGIRIDRVGSIDLDELRIRQCAFGPPSLVGLVDLRLDHQAVLLDGGNAIQRRRANQHQAAYQLRARRSKIQRD